MEPGHLYAPSTTLIPSLAVVDWPGGRESDVAIESRSEIKLVALQNNKVIVSGGQTGIVTLNYNRDGALMGTLPKNTPTQADRLSAISSIAFSKGSKLLAAGCTDSSVRVWDLKQQVRVSGSRDWMQQSIFNASKSVGLKTL